MPGMRTWRLTKLSPSGTGPTGAALTQGEGRFPTVRDSVFGFSMLSVGLYLPNNAISWFFD